MKVYILFICCFLIFGATNATVPTVAFIPYPENVEFGEGEFKFDSATPVVLSKKIDASFSEYLKGELLQDLGFLLPIGTRKVSDSSPFILFEKVKGLGMESYRLRVTPNKIVIQAQEYAGFFNGFQTLRQAISVNNSQGTVPCMTVEDHPRFGWRGVMIDVSRHFQTVESIKKQIDIFSTYKINKFHWHLTDDQGWRIEIDKYPELTAKGAWRADRTEVAWWERKPAKSDEEKTVGGFYTKEQVKEVIQYARVRNVEIIPEIDVPAHSKALVAAYPHLCCHQEGNSEVAVGGKAPDNAVCPGKSTSYEFLSDVISEIAELFPSKYFHIGGDECNKNNWKKCPDCQKLLKEEGYSDVEELQSHFIQKMHQIVSANGKEMIGWDEVLSGNGVAGATIMAWRRGRHTPEVDAPRQGYQTIMTDYQHSYISQVQGPRDMEPVGPKVVLPLSKVYRYEPIPEQLTAEEASLVLGSEACLWTEFVPTQSHLEYMLYPRVLANAEVAWSQPAVKDWDRFQNCVEAHFSVLEGRGVNVSKSLYKVYGDFALNELDATAQVVFDTETDYNIRYTITGEEPTETSTLYSTPFKVSHKTLVKAALFDKSGNRLGEITEFRTKK